MKINKLIRQINILRIIENYEIEVINRCPPVRACNLKYETISFETKITY